MAFQKFSEYLMAKGKFQQKPVVSVDGDTGPSGTAAPKPPKAATRGKNWRNEAAVMTTGDKEPPYSAPGTDPGQPKYEKGLLYKGDQNLVYNPKADDQKLNTDVKVKKNPEQLGTLEAKDYINHVIDKSEAINSILETVELIDNERDLFEIFVREVKKKGQFESLMVAVLNQPESFKEIANSLANEETSKTNAHLLAKAINETTSPVDVDEEDDLTKPTTAKTVKGTPTQTDNIKSSKKQYVMMKPEHNIIEALASYKLIRETMKSAVDKNNKK